MKKNSQIFWLKNFVSLRNNLMKFMPDYSLLTEQVRAFAEDRQNYIGVLANVAALIREATGWHWVGFYLVHGNELWLGPFQGPTACLKIPYGKGVCGTAWAERRTIVVPEVEAFPGHIACSSLSRSEIVVPIFKGDEVAAVLDIDSTDPGAFTEADRLGLESLCRPLNQ